MRITLSQINIYPIKACRGISLPQWEIEPRGFRHDRRWMLVDDTGLQITQRDFAQLTFVTVSLHDGYLRVMAPYMEELIVPFAVSTSTHIPIVVWNDGVEAVPVSNEASEWFSEYLGTSCTLVVMTERSVRFVNRQYAVDNDIVSFADAFPFLLLSEESLADLNARLPSPVPMKRFRPNLVVKGCEPFAEDGWKEITIGQARFHVVKPCARCTVPTIDTETGVKGTEPLRTLATYRSVDNKVLFGQNVIPGGVGSVNVGDEVQVISSKTHSYSFS